MNIAIIDMDSLKNPFWGAGQARATREVGKRLAKKHTITVYTSKYPGWKNYREDGITYKHVGIAWAGPRLTNWLFIFTIPLVVHNIHADVIIENFNAPTSVSFAPLFTSIPVIALPTMFNAIEFTKKYYLPFHWVEALGLKFYKYMLPYSAIDSAKAKRLNPSIKYKIVPQGVGPEFFAIRQKKPKFILFLGRYDIWQKGIDLLLKAYAKIANTIKYPLVIAGHGPDEEKIRKQIRELRLESKVKMIGSLYGEKKHAILSEALYTAFPSRHDELSLWALESLASGLPLVGFDLPETKWAKEDVYLKSQPFDLDLYAQLLVSATNPAIIEPMRKQARVFAKAFDWQKVADQFVEFIQFVLTNEKRLSNHLKEVV